MYQISAGNWSKPVNAGPMINTADNEASPFIHFDGQTLYFMRDGQKGLGGYDLYMTRKAIDGKWQAAENLGAPINSGSDEGAMSLHPDGIRAVITRETDFQRNDLFEFELPEKFRAAPLQALYVTITDNETHLPVRARVEVFEVDNLDTMRLSQWADEEGKIAVTLQRNKNYGLISSAEGYMMYSSNMAADTSALRHLNISMIKLSAAAEEVIVLRNIFFETGSASLLPASGPELNKLLWTLRNNTEMKIEIRGHTDDVGEERSNQVLSEARAKAVYDYLIGRGIESSRLTYKGFGETQPVADNTTPEGRKQNRRTEFRVVGN
jgi:outer membrane protein OmpA-like peptidoglycan-associated protein